MSVELLALLVAIAGCIGSVISWYVTQRQRRSDRRQAEEEARGAAGQRVLDLDLQGKQIAELQRLVSTIQESGDVVLDIIPMIQYAGIGVTDPVERYVVAEVHNVGQRTAEVRDAYIVNDDRIRLAACWVNGEMSAFAFSNPTVFSLAPGKKCTLYFAIREVRPGVLERIRPPDYGSAPWGHLSTARHVVVRCVNSEHQSHANEALNNFRTWVTRYRSAGGRRAG